MKIKEIVPDFIDLTDKVILDTKNSIYIWSQVEAYRFCFVIIYGHDFDKLNNRLKDPIEHNPVGGDKVPIEVIKDQFRCVVENINELEIISLFEAVDRVRNIENFGKANLVDSI